MKSQQLGWQGAGYNSHNQKKQCETNRDLHSVCLSSEKKKPHSSNWDEWTPQVPIHSQCFSSSAVSLWVQGGGQTVDDPSFPLHFPTIKLNREMNNSRKFANSCFSLLQWLLLWALHRNPRAFPSPPTPSEGGRTPCWATDTQLESVKL